jgi:hypothetical protein
MSDTGFNQSDRQISVETVPISSGDPNGRVAKWMISNGYATGHGDTVEDMLGELEWQAKERGKRA